MKIGRHRVRARFFIILVALLAVLGGRMYDKQEKRGQAGTTTGTIQTERTVYGYGGNGTNGAGTTGSAKGTGLLQSESEGSLKASSGPNKDEFSEPGSSQGFEEARSRPVSVSRGGDRWGTGDYINAGIFTVTAYTAGYESTGKRPGDKGYGEPAISGSKYADFEKVTVKKDHTIAADWGVLPPGTKVLIEGLSGTYVVEDKGAAIRGKHIDLYIPDLQEAKDWGVQRRKIIILEMGVL